MGMKKTVNFPLPVHLYKFLRASKVYDFLRSDLIYKEQEFIGKKIDCLVVTNYIPMARRHKELPEKWIANIPPNYKWAYVEMEDPTIQRLYYLYKLLADKFSEQIIQHMHIEKEVSNNAKLGLEKFLDKCDISEEDYKTSTGYKHWQRYQKKLEKRRNAA